MLVLRLLNAPTPDQRPVWFVIDELASLQKLPQLHTAITENRKSRNPLVLGFQGKAQLEVIYGHLAEVMLSQARHQDLPQNDGTECRRVGEPRDRQSGDRADEGNPL